MRRMEKNVLSLCVQSKYSAKTKRATANTFSANDLQGKKIGHESNLSEASSYCVRGRIQQRKQAVVSWLQVKDERVSLVWLHSNHL